MRCTITPSCESSIAAHGSESINSFTCAATGRFWCSCGFCAISTAGRLYGPEPRIRQNKGFFAVACSRIVRYLYHLCSVARPQRRLRRRPPPWPGADRLCEGYLHQMKRSIAARTLVRAVLFWRIEINKGTKAQRKTRRRVVKGQNHSRRFTNLAIKTFLFSLCPQCLCGYQ